MEAVKPIDLDDSQEIQKKNEEQEVVALLASLVKAHYLEKSNKFHMAMDFEKLFKLDRLELLKSLEELDKLKELDQLRSLDNLKELSKLRELSHLSDLKPLTHLERLEKLNELSKLERLTSLAHLDKLDNLQALEQLLMLKELNHLPELTKLKSLENLSELQKLQELDRLSDLKSLSQLENLQHLQDLEKLDNLGELKNLRDLEKLQIINTLNKLLEEHRSTLAPLNHLEKLMELVHLQDLHKLQELNNLQKLEELQQLDKLDRIDDARFAERLDKLDKLDILEKGTRKLVIQQFISFGLELLKLTVAGFVIVFLLTRESGREITAKALPAIGFGNAAQVNLGLKLLVGEMAPENFQSVVTDIRKRMDGELDAVYSTSGLFSIERRVELVNQILSYSFKGNGVDLAQEAKTKLDDRLMKLSESAVSRLEFDMALARGRKDTETESRLREIKLLLSQKQYPQLLEKVLPIWGSSEAVIMASVAGAISLKLQDPATLEELLRTIPQKGAL